MQNLCKVQLEWDESILQKIYSDWMLFQSDLEQLVVFKIPH